MFKISDIIELAIKIEQNGEKIYRKASHKSSNSNIHDLLKKLADEENLHIDFFLKIKESIQETSDIQEIEDMGKSILLEIMEGKAFSLGETDFSSIHHMNHLMATAIEFEKDTVIFYEMIHSLIEDDTSSALLEKIIREEEEHIRLFEGYLKA